MHLTESIHFTAITVRSGGDGAHSSQKHGAFLCSEVSFLERLAGGKTLFRVYRHWQYFITSLFTWSKKKKKRLVRSSSRRHRILFCGVELLKTQKTKEKQQQQQKKGISDGSSFPGSCAVTEENMGICGYLAVPGKCLVVLGLKLLFLVPAGVPARSGDSIFKDNITVRQGDSAVLK